MWQHFGPSSSQTPQTPSIVARRCTCTANRSFSKKPFTTHRCHLLYYKRAPLLCIRSFLCLRVRTIVQVQLVCRVFDRGTSSNGRRKKWLIACTDRSLLSGQVRHACDKSTYIRLSNQIVRAYTIRAVYNNKIRYFDEKRRGMRRSNFANPSKTDGTRSPGAVVGYVQYTENRTDIND